MLLTLYYHPLASFCHKVLIALYEHGVEFERRVINLADDADRAELHEIWPFNRFPVVRDHARNRDVAETTIIIEYLDRYFAAERLIPRDWDDALEVRLWDRIFDLYVQGPMQQLVGDRLRGANGDMTKERATLDTAYGMLDRHMATRTWVAGRGFSMADCAAAPALFYASTIQPFPDHPHLEAYFDRLTQRPSFRRVLEEAKPYFSFYPFVDAIPKKFR
ncbi:MAG: glutathione S-transferase [Gammaproteobacteria bacterium]|jgi:glutathione S-transferase|nr:glutathione S-transferase [Gammaproteobacteria bacterium]